MPFLTEEDGGKVKPANYQHDYTDEEVKELILCKQDPIYFIKNYVMIEHPTRGAMKFDLHGFQENLIKTYHGNSRVIAMLSRQCGKALALDTPIPTPTGWTTMGDINVGDMVLGDDGTPTCVTFVTDPMYGHECFNVEFDNGESIVADAEHIWRLDQIGDLTTKQLVENFENANYGIPIRMTDGLKLDNNSDSEISPYSIGLYLGLYGDYLPDGSPRRIPRNILRSSNPDRINLLTGILTSMGTHRGKTRWEITDSCDLIPDISELLSTLGIHHVVNDSTTKVEFDISPLHNGSGIVRITNITPTGTVPVKCIRVDNASHMFLCGRTMIPTHNTTTAAAYLLWWAIFKNHQKILIASKDQDGANEIMDRLWYAYEELPWFLKPGTTKNDITTKKFDNRSVIRAVATTKTSGRGKSNSIIYLDEFAFVRPSIAQDFWTSIYPTISTGGSIIITSTPNTDEDKFASIWFNCKMAPSSDPWKDPLSIRSNLLDNEEQETYKTIFENEETRQNYQLINNVVEDDDEGLMEDFIGFHAHWTKVPNADGTPRDERFKRSVLSQGFTNQEWIREYECGFVSGDSTLVSAQKLATLRNVVREPKFVDKYGTRWYEEIKPNVAYAVCLDPSEGVDQDDACIQVWELPTLLQVAEWNDNNSDQPEQTKMLRRILTRLYLTQQDDPDHNGSVDIYYSVERNGLGIGIIRTIEEQGEEKFPGWLIDNSETTINVRGEAFGKNRANPYRGLLTSASSKKRYCVEFKSLIERNLFKPRSRVMVSQLKTFVKSGNSYRAKEGSKDDVVMSGVIMCMLIDEIRMQEPDLDDYLAIQLDDDNYAEEDENHAQNMPMLPVV